MTKLDFPDTPSTGQQYGSSGTQWRWDGTRWGSTAGAAGARGRVAYAEITTNQGPFTTEASIVGLSVTINAVAGRTYRISSSVRVSESVVERVFIRIKEGATQLNIQDQQPGGSSMNYTPSVIVTPTAGAHTYLLSCERGSGGTGSVNIVATPTTPGFIMVEDITYEAGSSVSAGAGAVPVFANIAALNLYVPPNGSGMAQTAFPPTTWTYYNGVWYPTSGMMPAMTLASNTTSVPHGVPLSVSWNSNIGLQNHFQVMEDSGRALRIPYKGVYQFHLSVSWAPSATGSRVAMIKSNTNHIYALSSHYPPTANYGGGTVVSFVGPMAKDTILYCDLIQDSGGTLGLSTQNAGGWGTTWSAAYLGIM